RAAPLPDALPIYNWKAYTQNKAGQKREPLAPLQELRGRHPQSRWLRQAQALDLEVQGLGLAEPSALRMPTAQLLERGQGLRLLARLVLGVRLPVEGRVAVAPRTGGCAAEGLDGFAPTLGLDGGRAAFVLLLGPRRLLLAA